MSDRATGNLMGQGDVTGRISRDAADTHYA